MYDVRVEIYKIVYRFWFTDGQTTTMPILVCFTKILYIKIVGKEFQWQSV